MNGSVRDGMEVATVAAADLKRTHLELGGKAPRVIFDDADLAFFFSSRRRHTSSLRDWSSDVCSSDLAAGGVFNGTTSGASTLAGSCATSNNSPERSEERRVGKERRYRRWADH